MISKMKPNTVMGQISALSLALKLNDAPFDGVGEARSRHRVSLTEFENEAVLVRYSILLA